MCKHNVVKCIHFFLYPQQVPPGGTRLKIPKQFWRSIFRRPGMWCLMGAAIVLFNTSFTRAAVNYWNVASGDWSDTNPSPWSLGVEPVSSDRAYITNGGTVTVTQSGETCQNLYLGSISTGTLVMPSGSLTELVSFVGYSGTGTFTQTGGTNTTSNSLYLGYNSGSTGTYNLSGSGNLSAIYEYIGYSGTGTFTQTSGTNSISSYFHIGYSFGSTGTYYLSGSGQLSAGTEYIGSYGTGTFTQTGGTNTVSYINIGTNSRYTLTAGTLNLNGGVENQGVWDLSNSSAVINATSSIVDLSSAILANAGNVSLNLDSHSLLIVPNGFDPTHYFLSYTNTGILHQAGSALDISSSYSIYGAGSINDHVNCQGTLYTNSFISINGGLTISGTGSVNLGYGGVLYVNDSTSGMDSGLLSTYSQCVGSTGTGTFMQTGGTNSITNNFYLGLNSGSIGTYNLNGTGQLSSYQAYIGNAGTGTFTQTGGTNSITHNIYLGYGGGSSGTYNLNGPGLLSVYNEYIGYYGTGTFTQTGGTNSISSTDLFYGLRIGSAYGSSGTYNLSGTGYLSTNYEYIYSTGNFTQTGGTHSAIYIKIASNGTYTLKAGILNINGCIDNSGTWDLSNSSAVINASNSFLDLRSAILTNAGNVSLNIDVHSLLIVSSGFNPANYFASYKNAGLLYQIGSTLNISSDYNISGIGSIDDHVNCQGTLSATNNFSINLNGGLTFTGTGSVNLRDGNLYVNDAISGISSGSLKSYSQYIGSTDTGIFSQTGGTNTINDILYLGFKSGSIGIYNMNDTSKLSSNYEYMRRPRIGGFLAG